MIHSARKAAYSSVVGQSIMLLNADGAFIGWLTVIGCENPQQLADEVVAAINAPNRHAYKVGVAVGNAHRTEPEDHEVLDEYLGDVVCYSQDENGEMVPDIDGAWVRWCDVRSGVLTRTKEGADRG